jgi:type IX secretion system PorP/SprF family membrane protein
MHTRKRSFPTIFLSLLLAMASATDAAAQSRPQTTQYVLNYFLSNPAMTGLENYADIRMGHRRQWNGIEGAPITTWVTANLPLGENMDQAPPMSLPEEDDREQFFRLLPVERHHGIGLVAYSDKIGPYVSNSVNVSYAWHVPLTEGIALSAGLSAGFKQMRYDPAKNIYPDHEVDPVVLNQFGSKLSPDLNAGIMLYSGRFFAGASVQQILTSKYIDLKNSLATYNREYILSGGYNMMLNADEDIRLLISTLMRTDFSNPMSIDFNAKCTFASTWWAGASYRHEDAISGMVGLHVARNFNIAYAYDYTISDLGQFSKGSHELMLAFQLFKFNERVNPRVGW